MNRNRYQTWRAWVCALTVCVPTFAQSTVQNAEVEAFVLSYSAPQECPAQGDFEALTVALTSAARFTQVRSTNATETGDAPRRLTITISERKRDYFGTLELVDEQTRARRQFDAETCEEIVEALALATALAIDPNALGAAPPEPEEPAEPETGEEKLTEEEGAESPVREPFHHVVLGLVFDVTFLQASRPQPGEAISESRGSIQAPYVAPSLRWDTRLVGVLASVYGSLGYGWAQAPSMDLNWAPLGRLGFCPLWVEAGSMFRAAPCLGAGFARLSGAPSSEIPLAQTASRTYASVDLDARFELLFGRFQFGVVAGATTPTTGITYLLADIDGNDEVLLALHRRIVPRLGASIGLQLF